MKSFNSENLVLQRFNTSLSSFKIGFKVHYLLCQRGLSAFLWFCGLSLRVHFQVFRQDAFHSFPFFYAIFPFIYAVFRVFWLVIRSGFFKKISACFIDAFAYCWRFTFPGRGASPRKLRRNSIPSQLRSASEGLYKIIFWPKMSRTDLGCLRDPKMFSFLSSDGVKPLFTATDMIRKLEERDFPAILLATTFLGALGNTAVRGHFLSLW